MIERLLLQAALNLLRRKETQQAMQAGCAMTLIGMLLLLIFPIILLAVPALLLGAGIHSGLPTLQGAGERAREQIIYVERICDSATGYELEEWIAQMMQSFIASGVPEENIFVSIPAAEVLRIKASEVIILWSAELGDAAIDSRVKKIVDSFLRKDAREYRYALEGGGYVNYAQITVNILCFEEVLLSRALSEEQETIARLMLDFAHGNNQVNSGRWLGNDQLYDGGDRGFSDGQIPVRFYHQRDMRWANRAYAGESIGIAGCGPTAVAIVISSLLEREVTPAEIARWSEDNGYAAYNNGSYNSLIPNAMQHYGLAVSSGNDAETLKAALREGKLAVAIMGPGSFTPSGHFIALRGITTEGRILVADPVSLERSERSWDVQTILSEARNGTGSGGPIWIIERKK